MQRATRSQSTHVKRSASRKATQSTGGDKLVKKGPREHDGNNQAVLDPVARTHQYHTAERIAKGRGRQLVEHQFCAVGNVDREASASGLPQLSQKPKCDAGRSIVGVRHILRARLRVHRG